MKTLFLLIYSILAPIIIVGQAHIYRLEKAQPCEISQFEDEEVCYTDGTCEQLK